ncbi:enoyl-CoA hydratase/isomerase family protein, partial [Candidatus Entotheonella serta]
MSDTVLIEDDGPVRKLTLNRPEKLNAMNAELVASLTAAIQTAGTDDNVAVLVLSGAGRAFSAGADISKSERPEKPTGRQMMARSRHTTGLYRTFLESTKPIVAAVHGYVLGGGCNMAMCSDLVVAAENAVFGYPELKVGLAATAVTTTLVHQIGRKAAFELLTLCENIDAERALALGMINRIVPLEGLMDDAMRVAKQLSGFDHDAIWMTKRTIQRAAAMTPLEAMDMASDASLVMNIYKS